MNTCGTCQHREEPDEYRGGFGRCLLIPRTGDSYDEKQAVLTDADDGWIDDDAWMERCHPAIHAFTADASSYSSDLFVSPDFGCVHWQAFPRDTEETK